MSINVVFLNRSFYPDITATGQLLLELCEDLARDYDARVTVITGRPLSLIKDVNCLNDNFGVGLIKRQFLGGIEILRVRNTAFPAKFFIGRVCNYLTYFFFSFIASFKLKKPDLVITLTDPPIICLAGLFISRRFNIPFVVSVQDIFPEAAYSLGNYKNKTIDFLLDHINRFCFNKSDQVIALGEIMRKRLIEGKGIKENKISIIPDWADCSKIFPTEKKNTFSIKHGLADFFVVMYAGNLGALSGIETLVESAKLLKEHKDILFVLIGEGILKSKLLGLVQSYKLENIKFLPFQPKHILLYSFASADIFVILLKKGLGGYSLPSKIYPVLASGRPYVASVEEESEVADITKRFACGLLAEPEEPSGLAEKIMFLYDNKELRFRMGDNARKAAVLFDRRLGTKAYYELFKGLCDAKKGF